MEHKLKDYEDVKRKRKDTFIYDKRKDLVVPKKYLDQISASSGDRLSVKSDRINQTITISLIEK